VFKRSPKIPTLKLDEVRNALSIRIWKTRKRIFDEINLARVQRGIKPLPDEGRFSKYRRRLTGLLRTLVMYDEADIKEESELTDTELQWSGDPTLADPVLREATIRDVYMGFKRRVYRLTEKGYGRRKKDPDAELLALPELNPVT